ncbi:MAG TPA: succinate dehydrogenase assembly factor 2 [Methylophilaceae bacterium]|nr:succinate dehydrogenase assembly factor 2 [Methylophilaceae bacterium]
MQADARRILWRCRRGLLELDIVLARFVTRHYAALSESQLLAFDQLLDCADNDLLDLITGRKPHEHSSQQHVLELIRNTRFSLPGMHGRA